MRSEGTAQELEKRRFQAIRLLRMGYGPSEVARILEVTRRIVQRWKARFRAGGEKALRAKPVPGAAPKLSCRQKRQLVQALLAGAPAHGFVTELWTGQRVAALIRSKFGVGYHPRYIPRLLRSLDWSSQRPELRAYERDEQAIRHWIEHDWRRIKKSPAV